jgi:hypothetical protein
MSRQASWLAVWTALVLVATLSAGGCKKSPYDKEPEPDPTGPYKDVEKFLPKSKQLDGWVREGDDILRFAAGPLTGADKTVKDLALSPIAGQLPLYQEYGLTMVFVQPYIKRNSMTKTVVEIIEMKDPDEAFGIYSVTGAAGASPHAGPWLAGRKTRNEVAFVKGRYLVTVREQALPPEEAPKSPPAAEPGAVPVEPLVDFPQAVANAIFSGPTLPVLVTRLPAANQVPGTLAYLHGPEGLKKADELLGINMAPIVGVILGDAKMVAATYKPSGGNDNTVFIIDRFGGSNAPPETALEAYLNGATPQERNRFAYTMVGTRYVVGTFNAEEESVQRLLPEVIGKLGG